MREWECVEVKGHENVGRTIEQRQKDGLRLHTYQSVGAPHLAIADYLLFQRCE